MARMLSSAVIGATVGLSIANPTLERMGSGRGNRDGRNGTMPDLEPFLTSFGRNGTMSDFETIFSSFGRNGTMPDFERFMNFGRGDMGSFEFRQPGRHWAVPAVQDVLDKLVKHIPAPGEDFRHVLLTTQLNFTIHPATAADCDRNCENKLVAVNGTDGLEWFDTDGDTCGDYKRERWCNRDGSAGRGWNEEYWGVFSKYELHGMSATEACCACGGGIQAENDCQVEAVAHLEALEVADNFRDLLQEHVFFAPDFNVSAVLQNNTWLGGRADYTIDFAIEIPQKLYENGRDDGCDSWLMKTVLKILSMRQALPWRHLIAEVAEVERHHRNRVKVNAVSAICESQLETASTPWSATAAGAEATDGEDEKDEKDWMLLGSIIGAASLVGCLALCLTVWACKKCRSKGQNDSVKDSKAASDPNLFGKSSPRELPEGNAQLEFNKAMANDVENPEIAAKAPAWRSAKWENQADALPLSPRRHDHDIHSAPQETSV